jgi:hypothetical protein
MPNSKSGRCRIAQPAGRNIFSPLNSKLHLPPDRNAIILRAKVGIGPVGVRP